VSARNDAMAMGHGSWITKDDPFPALVRWSKNEIFPMLSTTHVFRRCRN